jgi:signal transduction histidine kinase
MASRSFERLQATERLRVGRRFLMLRPIIAALGAFGNSVLLASARAPALQKLVLASGFALAISAFFCEAWQLGRRELSERWLFTSLSLTLLVLGAFALCSGGLTSPILPLLFAPVVVGFAAFARARPSTLLLGGAIAVLASLALVAPLAAFPPLPRNALNGMLLLSSLTSFALLSVGVIGLVEAHARIALELDRLRTDMLQEAERRATSIEHLGAQVAHEVRNPLAAARGLVQLVERRVTDERDRQRLSVVVTEVDRALTVLSDYLSFARPLSDLTPGPVEVRGLLDDVAGVLEARAREKSLTIQVLGAPLCVWADRQRLRDALLNLALNALNALPPRGNLTLSAEQRGQQLVLSVTDDGPGMSRELVTRLGEPFTTETAGGTGLGVLLARSVARQHGGELRYETAPGDGTRALLELPLDSDSSARGHR